MVRCASIKSQMPWNMGRAFMLAMAMRKNCSTPAVVIGRRDCAAVHRRRVEAGGVDLYLAGALLSLSDSPNGLSTSTIASATSRSVKAVACSGSTASWSPKSLLRPHSRAVHGRRATCRERRLRGVLPVPRPMCPERGAQSLAQSRPPGRDIGPDQLAHSMSSCDLAGVVR